MEVRDARVEDLPAIRDLYNATIFTSTGAWTEEPETFDWRRAFVGGAAAAVGTRAVHFSATEAQTRAQSAGNRI